MRSVINYNDPDDRANDASASRIWFRAIGVSPGAEAESPWRLLRQGDPAQGAPAFRH